MKNITNQKKRGISSDQDQLHYGISLKLYFKDKVLRPGISALLRGVESTGSLQEAAQTMSMTYSKAWKMLKESEKAWRFALTKQEIGEGDGGGSTLASQVAQPLEAYDALTAETRQKLDRLFEKYSSREWAEDLK